MTHRERRLHALLREQQLMQKLDPAMLRKLRQEKTKRKSATLKRIGIRKIEDAIASTTDVNVRKKLTEQLERVVRKNYTEQGWKCKQTRERNTLERRRQKLEAVGITENKIKEAIEDSKTAKEETSIWSVLDKVKS